MVVVFLLGSIPTVEEEPSEKTATKRKRRSNINKSSNRNQWDLQNANSSQTQQKLYFATILDLKHQRTPLRIR